MGLRWLNGHAVDYKVKGEMPKNKKAAKEALEDKRKRLIVEFAIENANVVSRRSDREDKAREPKPAKGEADGDDGTKGKRNSTEKGQKRKRESSSGASRDAKRTKDRDAGKKVQGSGAEGNKRPAALQDGDIDKDKLAQRTRIIAQKRQKRKANRAGK